MGSLSKLKGNSKRTKLDDAVFGYDQEHERAILIRAPMPFSSREVKPIFDQSAKSAYAAAARRELATAAGDERTSGCETGDDRVFLWARSKRTGKKFDSELMFKYPVPEDELGEHMRYLCALTEKAGK